MKGGKAKVTSKEKQKLKKEYQEAQKKIYTIALPTLAVIFLFIVVYVYLKSRPRSDYIDWSDKYTILRGKIKTQKIWIPKFYYFVQNK